MGLRRGFGSPTRIISGGSSAGSASGPSGQAQLLRLFGRHQLEHFPLTAGDQEHFAATREALRVAQPARLRRPHRPHRRAASRAPRAPRPTSAAGGTAVLVDEFQDLSLAQYEVITGISPPGTGTASRWATTSSRSTPGPAPIPAILERFGTDFGVAQPIVLDRNRRCSRQIFEAARRVIALNPGAVREAARGRPRVGALRRVATPSPTRSEEADLAARGSAGGTARRPGSSGASTRCSTGPT